MTMETVRNKLCALFLAAAAAAADRLRSLNLPLTVTEDVPIVRRHETGWQSSYESATHNLLTREMPAVHYLAPLVTPQVVATGLGCAADLVASKETNLPFFSPLTGHHIWAFEYAVNEQPAREHPSFESDPSRWTLEHLILPALMIHLRGVESLGEISDRDADHFAREVIDVATADHMEYRIRLALDGIRIASSRTQPLIEGKAQLRSLSTREQGQLLPDLGTGQFRHLALMALPRTEFSYSMQGARLGPNLIGQEIIHNWLCAFHLHGFTPVGRDALTEAYPAWVGCGVAGTPLRMREQAPEQRTVTAADFRRVAATAIKLGNRNLNQPGSTSDLALHRFYIGAGRQSDADAVVDFVVALEVLLLPYDKQTRYGDLAYRFRMHGAHYLASKKSERREIFDLLNSLYDLRSRLVHGGKFPDAAAVAEGRTRASELARTGLLRAVSEGFPTAADYKQLML